MRRNANTGRPYTSEQAAASSKALAGLYSQVLHHPIQEFSSTLIQHWHLEFASTLGIVAGEWRTGRITFGSYEGVPPEDIEQAMQEMLEVVNVGLSYYIDALYVEESDAIIILPRLPPMRM